MRTTFTFILRLVVDPQSPRELRGTLQLVSEGQPFQPFNDEAVLLQLLKQVVKNASSGNRE